MLEEDEEEEEEEEEEEHQEQDNNEEEETALHQQSDVDEKDEKSKKKQKKKPPVKHKVSAKPPVTRVNTKGKGKGKNKTAATSKKIEAAASSTSASASAGAGAAASDLTMPGCHGGSSAAAVAAAAGRRIAELNNNPFAMSVSSQALVDKITKKASSFAKSRFVFKHMKVTESHFIPCFIFFTHIVYPLADHLCVGILQQTLRLQHPPLRFYNVLPFLMKKNQRKHPNKRARPLLYRRPLITVIQT